MDIVIRKAIETDAAAVWQIRNAAIQQQCRGFYPDDLLDRWTEGHLTDAFIKVVVEKFYVATNEGEVVGTGMICLKSGQLDAIFVQPDMMGRGVGRAMMTFLEEQGCQAGLKELMLNSTLNAANFYRRCGFVGDAPGIYQSPRGFALDCIPMKKTLRHRNNPV